MTKKHPPKVGFITKSLSFIEKVGNKLPHPAILFAIFALLTIILSGIVAAFNVSAIHPGTKEEIHAFSLLSVEGLHMIMSKMVVNFTSFAPLGTVLVALMGIGVMEASGFFSTALRKLVLAAPPKMLTFAIVFAGLLSNAASEIGYIVLIPLGAMIFLAVGRHPIAGMAAAFAGVSGGYSANIILGTIDPLLAGLTEEAAHIIDPLYQVNPAANFFFMATSTFVIAIAGTWITEKIVEPRLGKYTGDAEPEELKDINLEEKRGLKFSAYAFYVLLLLMVWSVMPISGGIWDYVPGSGFLRNAETGAFLNSPFMSGIVAIIFIIGAVVGLAYGIGAGTLKTGDAVIAGMGKSMATLGTYIVLVFFAAQFVAYFNWTNLGVILAVKGANAINSIGLSGIPLLIFIVLMAAILNFVMGSASAKWAILAPVFVPMFMLLGYSPEVTQMAYRVGDSVTNIISPMMSYFALIVTFMAKYDKKAGIGTIIATMLPYSVIFLIIWTAFMIVWVILGLPIGPGSELYYNIQ